MPINESAAKPAKCPACTATSDEQACMMCTPTDGECPIVDAGFSGPYWPTQEELNARLAEEVTDAHK